MRPNSPGKKLRDVSGEYLTKDPMISLFELLVLEIVLISYISVLLLVLNVFKPGIAIISGLVFSLLLLFKIKPRINLKDKRFHLGLFLVLAIGFLFRYDPYLYLLGGQDEGLYVNMSMAYSRTGSTFIKDRMREKLRLLADPKIIEYYDKHNQKNRGSHLPGVYIKDLENSEYVFQFYPLHPLWMANFSAILGQTRGIYSLTFFSLLSLIFFYFLGYELGGRNKKTGFLTGLLLALNPLHAFFSKFPVTEVVALAFTSGSFYYLARYHRESKKGKENDFYLLLSLGLAACFFFTRISGFMYLPFYYLLFLLLLFSSEKKRIKKGLFFYLLGILLLYVCSVLYGLYYSRPYSLDIYRLSFSRMLGKNWLFALKGGGVSLAVFSLFLIKFKEKVRFFAFRIIRFFGSRLHFLLLGLIALGFYRFYQLGFTDFYLGHYWIDKRWKMAGLGWRSIKYTRLFAGALYLSPIGALLLVIAYIYYCRKRKIAFAVPKKLLMVFLLLFWLCQLVVGFTLPYHYYYARYLLSEVVPYSLLLVALFVAAFDTEKKRKKLYLQRFIFYPTIFLMILFFGYYTFCQFRGDVVEDARVSLDRVASYINEEDLLLIDRRKFFHYGEIITSLSYFYNLKTFTIASPEDLVEILEQFIRDYEYDVFLLSQRSFAFGFLQEKDRIFYKEGRFKHDNKIPTEFGYFARTLYLYKLDRVKFIKALIFRNRIFNIKDLKEAGITISGFYQGGVWTNGTGVIRGLDLDISSDSNFLVIHTKGYNPYRKDLNKLKLKVLANGNSLEFLKQEDNSYWYKLDKINFVDNLEIISNTFIPSELGMNNDQRALGLDVAGIELR